MEGFDFQESFVFLVDRNAFLQIKHISIMLAFISLNCCRLAELASYYWYLLGIERTLKWSQRKWESCTLGLQIPWSTRVFPESGRIRRIGVIRFVFSESRECNGKKMIVLEGCLLMVWVHRLNQNLIRRSSFWVPWVLRRSHSHTFFSSPLL